MTTKPKRVYKYRGFNNIEYVMDILKNHRLYFPTRDELNDPLEGMCQPLYFTYMGVDYYIKTGIEQPECGYIFNQFRVLSFSRHWNSMQMWAHYAQNYNGVCIGFDVKDSLKDIKEVTYTNRRYPKIVKAGLSEVDPQLEKTIVDRNLYTKSKNWKYEAEYRIVKKQTEKYLEFDPTCISSVILGNLSVIDDENLQKVYEVCMKQNIPLYYVRLNLNEYGLARFEFRKEDYRRGLYDPRNILIGEYSSGRTAILHHHDDGLIEILGDLKE